MATLAIVLVSYNTREMTLNCLRHLRTLSESLSAEVWLVDNASADETAEAVAKLDAGIRVIASPVNVGFGRGNNLAMERCSADYMLLLNTDAFPEAGCIAQMAAYLDERPDVAAVAPQLLNEDGSNQRSWYGFPTLGDVCFHQVPIHRLVGWRRPLDCDRSPVVLPDGALDVDFVVGACMMVRRRVYQQVGGFDPDFFMYVEEADWQKRMRKAGFRVACLPTARCKHLYGVSSGRDEARIARLRMAGTELFLRKHAGRLPLLMARTATIVGSIVRVALFGAVAAASPGRARVRASLRQAWMLLRRPCLTKRPAGTSVAQ